MQTDALAPNFASHFQCTQSACPENCCGSINVVLDKPTLELYTTHPALIPVVQEYLVTTEDGSQTSLIKDPTTGTCPMLDTDSLCLMRRDFGEETLSQQCLSYPRRANWLGADLLITLSESCPEAARLLIENDDAMDLNFAPFSLPDRMVLSENTNSNISAGRYHYLQSLLTLLRYREQPLELRLFIIGLYTQRADAIINNPEGEDIEALNKLTELFFTLIGQGYFEEQAKKMQNPDKHALGLVLLNVLKQQGVQGSLYEDVRNVIFTLEKNKEISFSQIHLEKLNQADINYLQPLIKQHPVALENLMVNWLLTDLFPLKEPSITQGWLSLMLRYLLFKTLLSGTGLHQGKLQQSDITRITYRFARGINLSNTLDELEINLNNRNLNNLTSIAHALHF